MTDTQLQHQLHQALSTIVAQEDEILSLVFATPDGRTLVAVVEDETARTRLAAMSSSIIALTEQLSRAERIGTCRQLLVEGTAGVATVRRIAQSLVLVLAAKDSISMGYLAHHARRCERLVAETINQNTR